MTVSIGVSSEMTVGHYIEKQSAQTATGSVLPRYLKACQFNMSSFLDVNTICRKNKYAFIDC